MATTKTILGVAGAVALGVAGVVASISTKPVGVVSDATIAAKKKIPKDAKHLWAKQPDGGTLLREPLPTLDDGGCQAWAQRCANGTCKGSCE